MSKSEDTPQEHPTLTAEQKLAIRDLQVKALALQAQKLQLDSQFEKAITELNGQYQAIVQAHPGFSFDADKLEFSAQ